MPQSEHTESQVTELVARAVEGDTPAFGALYDRYLVRIYRYIYYQVTDHAEAEDLAEAVFLKAWEALPHSRPRGATFQAWLYRIAHNAVVDRHRRRKPAVSLEELGQFRDPGPMPEKVVEDHQEIARLAAALSRLKPRLRQVILCRFISELSHAETAQVLGVTEGHVRVLQHRALKQMRDLLEEDVV